MLYLVEDYVITNDYEDYEFSNIVNFLFMN